jgi:hypothetical protein
MDWLNLHTSTLDSAEFIGAEPTQRATWLCLQRYCIGQENGGHISDCADWSDRRWQQLCRVTRREVLSSCTLWTWESGSLVVWSYPAEKEAEVIHKRNVARENGLSGGRPRKTTDIEPTLVLGPISYDKPTSVISPKAEGKGKEGEWKGKEGNTPRKRGSKVVGYSLSEQSEEVRERMLNINSLKTGKLRQIGAPRNSRPSKRLVWTLRSRTISMSSSARCRNTTLPRRQNCVNFGERRIHVPTSAVVIS